MLRNLPLVALAFLISTPAIAQDGGVYQEEGGIVVVEIESTPPGPGWAEETISTGFTFESYYRWNGGNNFNSPGSGVTGYRVNLSQGTKWFLSLHNRHDDPDDTEENDVWVRADGGTWFKCFSNSAGGGHPGAWNWDSRFDVGNQPPASWNLSAGEHLIEFSGRSHNFKMDRFHIHIQGHPDSNDESLPESTALLGESYCGPAVTNSTGNPGVCDAWGSTFVVLNDVTLTGSDLPTNEFSFFVVSETQAFVQGPGGSQGNLCLGGNIGRYANDIMNTGSSGSVSLTIDLDSIPTTPSSSVQPGDTWSFQLWHRDKNPGNTSNFTDGRAIQFQ